MVHWLGPLGKAFAPPLGGGDYSWAHDVQPNCLVPAPRNLTAHDHTARLNAPAHNESALPSANSTEHRTVPLTGAAEAAGLLLAFIARAMPPSQVRWSGWLGASGLILTP
jgi:hypothetical protein